MACGYPWRVSWRAIARGEIARPGEERKITDKAEPRGRRGDFKEGTEGDGRKRVKKAQTTRARS